MIIGYDASDFSGGHDGKSVLRIGAGLYFADLIGLPVVTDDGEAIGTTTNIMNYGATDIVEIAPETGAPFMVPLIPDAVPDWDSERLVLARAFLP